MLHSSRKKGRFNSSFTVPGPFWLILGQNLNVDCDLVGREGVNPFFGVKNNFCEAGYVENLTFAI